MGCGPKSKENTCDAVIVKQKVNIKSLPKLFITVTIELNRIIYSQVVLVIDVAFKSIYKNAYAVLMLSAASEVFGSPSTRYISFLSPHL